MKSLAIFLLALLSLGTISCTDDFAEDETPYETYSTEGDNEHDKPKRGEQ